MGKAEDSDGVPTYIPRELVVPRTRSEDLTGRMRLLDHSLVRMDGPPDVLAWVTWDDDDDTDVDIQIMEWTNHV